MNEKKGKIKFAIKKAGKDFIKWNCSTWTLKDYLAAYGAWAIIADLTCAVVSIVVVGKRKSARRNK